MGDTRDRATALLDVLGVGTEGDLTTPPIERARAFAGCFTSRGRTPWELFVTMSDALTNSDLAAEVAKTTCYPLDALAWAWADEGIGPGLLDRTLNTTRRNGKHPWVTDGLTPMGAAMGWWVSPKLPRGTLVLSSDTGPGKTVAAVYVAVRKRGTFIRAAELGEIALGRGKATLDQLSYEPFLVIDELGRESDIRPTPHRVTELLATRHDRGLRTLITTQLSRKHETPSMNFTERYGHHLLDRIERGDGGWMEITIGSRRGNGGPRLRGLMTACRIAHLVPRVIAQTSAAGPHDRRAVDELQRLMNVSDERIEQAAAKRSAWMDELMREAAALQGPIGDVVRRVAAGEPRQSDDRRPEVVDE